MTISEILLTDYDPEIANTRKVLERIPEDNPTWTPDPKSMPIGRLAVLVSRMPEWAIDYLSTRERDFSQGWGDYTFTSRNALLDTVDRTAAELRAKLAAATDDDLLLDWTARLGDKVILSGTRLFCYRVWFMNHLIHHRTQLTGYLRLLHLPVPALYGPSSDDRLGF